MGTIQTFLTDQFGNMEDPLNSVEIGPSTSNKIERWWKELHERMELYIKEQLNFLLRSHAYNPNSEIDKKIMAYIFVPVVQRECDIFARGWNAHRVRHQAGVILPSGVPNHIFNFPEKYNAEDKHIPVTENSLLEVSALAKLDESPLHYINEEDREAFSNHLAHPQDILCKDLVDSYTYLKSCVT